jgi:VWFA-related protein
MRLALAVALLGFAHMVAAGQQDSTPASAPPSSAAVSATSKPGRIFLDVVVSDASGKLAGDLEPFDFTIVDNGQPRKVMSYRRTDGVAGSKFDPPVEVVFVVDAVNLSYRVVSLLRLDLEKFLRQNGGHLSQPVSILIFGSKGMDVQQEPSRDGNALASNLDKPKPLIRAMGSAGDVYGEAEQFQKSMNTLAGIAENEGRKPGRKMVIWMGPGWPFLEDARIIQTNESRQAYFKTIVDLSHKLREARITLYCLFPAAGILSEGTYETYLKPVLRAHDAQPGNLALEVSNDVPGQIGDCIRDIGAYYTLSFTPAPAGHADEYHELRVEVTRTGLTARTNAGYYDQPPALTP